MIVLIILIVIISLLSLISHVAAFSKIRKSVTVQETLKLDLNLLKTASAKRGDGPYQICSVCNRVVAKCRIIKGLTVCFGCEMNG